MLKLIGKVLAALVIYTTLAVVAATMALGIALVAVAFAAHVRGWL